MLNLKAKKSNMLKNLLCSREANLISLDSFNPETFLILKNYPNLKKIHFLCTSMEFFTHLSQLYKLLSTNSRDQPIDFSFFFEVNQPIDAVAFKQHPLMKQIKSLSVKNNVEPSALSRIMNIADHFLNLEEFIYKESLTPFSF